MTDKIITAWNFSNTDKNLLSPNKEYRIEYGILNEIAMGAPLGGISYLTFKDKIVTINDWTAGPVLWSDNSQKVALPIWSENRKQKILIVDVNTLLATLYKKEFRVLHFESFIDDHLKGIDSPLYNPEILDFNLNSQEVAEIQNLYPIQRKAISRN
ncbi:hypothetical protein [Chryseobacterium sp. CFS15]|uniref:hypothetical protein n=1 Tax=Chryseobacterium sp. CFS15 TaxID=2986946 RepID=UPI0028077E65|nr:hypothetical protein [Chryseobacterium sp. CFS15]MDQ8140458.1 hypothetical protein [Chryseobacterium sp. CFS15]